MAVKVTTTNSNVISSNDVVTIDLGIALSIEDHNLKVLDVNGTVAVFAEGRWISAQVL